MKWTALLLVILLLPAMASAQEPCPSANSLLWHPVYLPASSDTLYPGETWAWEEFVMCINYQEGDPDTAAYVCMEIEDTNGWINAGYIIINEGPGVFGLPGNGCWGYFPASLTFSCDTPKNQSVTIYFIAALADTNFDCRTDCAPTDTFALTVYVDTPPDLRELVVYQDSITYVDQGQTAAYIPFQICYDNPDLCAEAVDVEYNIVSTGTVGPAINTLDTVTVAPGDCETVFGVIDAGAASICDYDQLTITAHVISDPSLADTCVQVIHVVEPLPVPFLTAPFIAVFVLALVLAAAVFLRKRAKATA